MTSNDDLAIEESFDDPLMIKDSSIAALKARCVAAKIHLEERQGIDDSTVVAIQLKSGRNDRPISIYSEEDALVLLDSSFESITPLGNYAAYLDKKNNYIEAGLRQLDVNTIFNLHSKLLGISSFRSNIAAIEAASVQLPSNTQTQNIVIGPSTPLLKLVGGRFVNRRGLSIRVTGVQIDRHDLALELLERLANSVFFDIDLLLDVPVSLTKVSTPSRRHRTRADRGSRQDLKFPIYEYDQQAMALYWYARSARGMPLLQYLAFYQSLEFYFPIYSRADAQRRMRNVLKDPKFRADRDADLTRLFTVASDLSGRAFGEERKQLQATLNECLNADELRIFLRSEDIRKAYFSTKSKALRIGTLSIDREDSDIRHEVANRIYDIRCKIVHTKSGSESEVDRLLPFSEEADELGFDIDLVQYVSQKVLIASSRPFNNEMRRPI